MCECGESGRRSSHRYMDRHDSAERPQRRDRCLAGWRWTRPHLGPWLPERPQRMGAVCCAARSAVDASHRSRPRGLRVEHWCDRLAAMHDRGVCTGRRGRLWCARVDQPDRDRTQSRCRTILEAALTEPRRFDAIVLAAPASTSGLDFLPDDSAFEALAHPTPDQQRELAAAAFRHPPDDAELDDLMTVIASATPEHIEGAARSMRDFTRQADLAQLSVRSLLVCGDRDWHVPLRNHLATHQRIPRCGLQVYFDVGHVPFVEVPDRFAADVGRFLSYVVPTDLR